MSVDENIHMEAEFFVNIARATSACVCVKMFIIIDGWDGNDARVTEILW